MSMGGRWSVTLLGAGMALVSACDLSSLADKLAADFERGIQERADEEIRNAQKRIGEDGGEVKAYGGAVAVPEGAVEGDVEVAVAETHPDALQAELPGVLQPVTPPMAFTPHGTKFEAPVTISLFFERGLADDNLHVVRLDDEQDTSWERVDPNTVQYGEGVALVNTTHFSVYGVVKCEALPGALANVCDQFKSGELSLDELRELAPPDTNAWEGFEPSPRPDDGGDDRPPEPSDECKAVLDQCMPVFETCGKEPEADICAGVQDCVHKLEQCGGVVQPPEADCAFLADACRQGDEGACQAYTDVCSGDDAPIDDCSRLYEACEYDGNQDACYKFEASCTDVEPPPPSECEELGYACRAGDQQACLKFEEGGCGGVEPPPPPPEDCISWFLCGPESCREAITCPPEPPPVPTDVQPPPGSYVDCYSEDGKTWDCTVYPAEPAPSDAP